MFKDFNKRLQRDLKKIVDARVLESDDKRGGEVKVSLLVFTFLMTVQVFYQSLF